MLGLFHINSWKRNYPSNWIEYLCSPCGRGLRLVNFFHQKILRINGKHKFMIHFTSKVSGNIEISKSSLISLAVSHGCYFQGINGIVIGENTIIAPNVSLISANHDLRNKSKHIKQTPITIGDNCWIGTGAVILPGVTIGNNSIIGANCVVTKSYEAGNVVLAGIPAKVLKEI